MQMDRNKTLHDVACFLTFTKLRNRTNTCVTISLVHYLSIGPGPRCEGHERTERSVRQGDVASGQETKTRDQDQEENPQPEME